MVRLKESMNPEEQPDALGCPTRYETGRNRHGLHCRECGGLYYVDDFTHEKVMAAPAVDATENPFLCGDCEETYAEEAYAEEAYAR